MEKPDIKRLILAADDDKASQEQVLNWVMSVHRQ